MADRLQVYKCELCGNIVEVVHAGAGDLVCCGESMVLLEASCAEISLRLFTLAPVIWCAAGNQWSSSRRTPWTRLWRSTYL
jgi:desulfoferrodoxin-like iron-binding protein